MHNRISVRYKVGLGRDRFFGFLVREAIIGLSTKQSNVLNLSCELQSPNLPYPMHGPTKIPPGAFRPL